MKAIFRFANGRQEKLEVDEVRATHRVSTPEGRGSRAITRTFRFVGRDSGGTPLYEQSAERDAELEPPVMWLRERHRQACRQLIPTVDGDGRRVARHVDIDERWEAIQDCLAAMPELLAVAEAVEEWRVSETKRGGRPRRTQARTKPRNIRLTDEEWAAYRAEAAAMGVTVSEWIRAACEAFAEGPARRR